MSAFQVVPASDQQQHAASNDPNDIKLKVSWTKDQLKHGAGLPVLQDDASGTFADDRHGAAARDPAGSGSDATLMRISATKES